MPYGIPDQVVDVIRLPDGTLKVITLYDILDAKEANKKKQNTS